MFTLIENYEVDRRILKGDYMRYSLSEISTINTPNRQIYNNVPGGDSVNNLLGSLLRLNFDVLHAATNNRYINGDGIRLVNEGPIALFSNYKLQSSSGKHIEEINHAHMYNLTTSGRLTDDLSIGFDRDRGRRQEELTNNKNIKGKYHLTIMLKDIFGFAEHQEKGTYGLGYKLTITRNSDNAVLNKGNAINNAKIKIDSIDWYIPIYTPSLSQEQIVISQIVNKKPTELTFVERSVFMQEVNTQNFWTFELGTQKRIHIHIWIIVGFQQSGRQHDQNLTTETFCRPPVTSAQSIIGTKKNPDSAILSKYNDDDYSQEYSQIKETFRIFTKDDILKPSISDNDFKSTNDGNNIGYNLYVFDIRYQKIFESTEPIKVEFKFDGVIPAGLYGYSSVLTNKLLSISSDGPRHFDLI